MSAGNDPSDTSPGALRALEADERIYRLLKPPSVPRQGWGGKRARYGPRDVTPEPARNVEFQRAPPSFEGSPSEFERSPVRTEHSERVLKEAPVRLLRKKGSGTSPGALRAWEADERIYRLLKPAAPPRPELSEAEASEMPVVEPVETPEVEVQESEVPPVESESEEFEGSPVETDTAQPSPPEDTSVGALRALEAKIRKEKPKPAAIPTKPWNPSVVGQTSKLKLQGADESLKWPVSGTVVSNYSSDQEGVTVLAKLGAPVKTVRGGTVEMAEWYGGIGLGNVVVVLHDDDIRSIYTHLGEFRVEVGDSIEEGTEIGTVGSSGGLLGRPALYFEVRRGFGRILRVEGE